MKRLLFKFRYWLFVSRKIKMCNHCCVLCEYFDDCVENVKYEQGVDDICRIL